jgi:ribosomal protein S6E (S10)
MLIYREEAHVLTGRNIKEALVFVSKETGLEVNADITKYMVTYRGGNKGRSHSMKSGNNSFERVENFKYLGTTFNKSKFC